MKFILFIWLATVFLFCGCQSKQKSQDEAAIKTTYTQFRGCLLQSDLTAACRFLASDYLLKHPVETISFSFGGLLETNMELTSSSWVEFDRKDKSKAVLFPRTGPTVGYEFVDQTNGWRITGHLVPVVD